MKTETFTAKGLRITRQYDRWNGALYLAWKPDVSMAFRDTKALLKFCAWPAKTPTGDALREWLASVNTEASVTDTSTSVSPEYLATGFGPECHDIDNNNTRTVI